MNVGGPKQKWAGDISHVWSREGWLYLAVILDLHSRGVIGWPPLIDTAYRRPGKRYSNRMKRDLAIGALNTAIAFRTPPGAAFIIPTGEANTLFKVIRSDCARTASLSR